MCSLTMSTVLLFGVLSIGQAIQCPEQDHCECVAEYISCRGGMRLPDVIASRVYPMKDSPPIVADLRGNALSHAVLLRFLLVFPTLRRVILTEQLESICDHISTVRQTFPQVLFETDCEVSIPDSCITLEQPVCSHILLLSKQSKKCHLKLVLTKQLNNVNRNVYYFH